MQANQRHGTRSKFQLPPQSAHNDSRPTSQPSSASIVICDRCSLRERAFNAVPAGSAACLNSSTKLSGGPRFGIPSQPASQPCCVMLDEMHGQHRASVSTDLDDSHYLDLHLRHCQELSRVPHA